MEGLDTGDGYAVRDIGLADEGSLRVDWARSRMPVLAAPVSYTHLTLPTTMWV